jgi:hypothetical protein
MAITAGTMEFFCTLEAALAALFALMLVAESLSTGEVTALDATEETDGTTEEAEVEEETTAELLVVVLETVGFASVG